MCGIFGYFSRPDKLPFRFAIETAVATLNHRGPDSLGILFQPEIGLALGHARLSIIDPDPRSDQPFLSLKSSLVFNGEIYNYRQIRQELLELGACFKTEGDTEVIGVGYDFWGVGVFDRLRGMYALALYDTHENCLHLARDEFGIKPLCFLLRNNSVVFASEIKAIAALTSLSIDGGVLSDMLSWGFQTDDSSLYSEVRYLAPGARKTITFNQSGTLAHQDFETWFTKRAYTNQYTEIDLKGLRSVVECSVAEHLIADVPVAIALSGGLDSSIIAASAAQIRPSLKAYTFTLSNEQDAEVKHADIICRHLGLAHHVVRMKTNSSQNWLRQVAWHLEEPIVNINALLNYGLASFIHNQGFKVILVGEGADELFAGYPWYRFALDPTLAKSPGLIFDAYRRRRAQLSFTEFLHPKARELAADRVAIQCEKFVERLQEIPQSLLNGFLSYDQQTQLQYSQLLRIDRMFMAHGVEARVPFIYRSVLAASALLPDSDKLKPHAGGGGRDEKIALANAFGSILPQSIALRPKFGQQGTVNLWDTDFSIGLVSEFDRCLHSNELRGARQMLDEFIDWNKVGSINLTAKQKFSLALTVEAVDCMLLSRQHYQEASLFNCDIVN